MPYSFHTRKGGFKLDKNKTISERIKNERNRMGINQAQLAKEAKITPAAVSQIEKGLRTPSLPVLQRIANVFSVSMDYLSGNTSNSELNDILQNKEIYAFYEGFQALPDDDKQTILKNIDFLQEKHKKNG